MFWCPVDETCLVLFEQISLIRASPEVLYEIIPSKSFPHGRDTIIVISLFQRAGNRPRVGPKTKVIIIERRNVIQSIPGLQTTSDLNRPVEGVVFHVIDNGFVSQSPVGGQESSAFGM